MNRTIYRWKVLIADFFNKIPAVILIPGILLASFLIAVLLIWTGTKVAVIDIVEPFTANSNTNSPRSLGANNKNDNIDNNPDLYQGSSNPALGGSRNQSGSGSGSESGSGLESTTGQAGNGSGGSNGGGSSSSSENPRSQTVNDNAASNSGIGPDQASGSQATSTSGEPPLEAVKRLPSTSAGSSESDNENYNSNVSENCTYPEGDVQLWWRRAPKKQRDCYIKKNGFPGFLAKEPYFCDYEKNEDCYVK